MGSNGDTYRRTKYFPAWLRVHSSTLIYGTVVTMRGARSGFLCALSICLESKTTEDQDRGKRKLN